MPNLQPPYYAVIFTSVRRVADDDVHEQMGEDMFRLGSSQPGFLAAESVQDNESKGAITLTYWDSLANIEKWKMQADHMGAQKVGGERFYENYHARIAKGDRE